MLTDTSTNGTWINDEEKPVKDLGTNSELSPKLNPNGMWIDVEEKPVKDLDTNSELKFAKGKLDSSAV